MDIIMDKNKVLSLKYKTDAIIPREELILAHNELCKYAKNKSFFRLDQFHIQIGVCVDGDFTYQNQRRSYFSDCFFNKTNLAHSGMTGSFFLRTQFENCDLTSTVLDSCNFTECTFRASRQNNTLLGTNFNNAVFVNCTFENMIFDSCMASNALFEGTLFLNCTFLGVLWEYSTFKNVSFKNGSFKGLNFEMCVFENIHMYNIRLPFPTIPYIINGVNYVCNTKDHLTISSAAHESGAMSKEDYKRLLPVLKTFYTGTQNYYPLANIYIGEGDYDNAYRAIINAFKMAIKLHSFRNLKSYCLLLRTIEGLDQHHFNYVYEVIQKEISIQTFRPTDYYILSQYLSEVRNLLVCGNSGTVVGITIKTEIDENDFTRLGIVISIISNLIDYRITKANNFIEIRHYSPYEIFCQITSNPETIFYIIGLVYSGLLGVDTLIKKFREYNTKNLTDKQVKAQTRLFNAQAEQIELDNQIKKNEMNIDNQNRKIQDAQNEIRKNHIIINSISHTIINGDIIECDAIFQNHSEIRK